MPRPVSPQSLRTELLVNFAILAVAALVFAVASVVLMYDALDPGRAVLYISLLIAADVAVVVGFGAYQLRRLVLQPLRRTAAAAEAIAAGDLHRRVEAHPSRELLQLATSVNRMTERLLHEQAQLVRAEKLASVGRLAAGIAHEIGNPLGAISGYAHLLRVGAAGDPRALEAVGGLERETARIDRIVRGLLDYARPRRESPAPVDVNDTLRHVAGLVTEQGHLRHVALMMTLAQHAPVVNGDRHELEQVFVNLLLNAADAAGHSGVVAVSSTIMTRAVIEAGFERRAGDSATRTAPHPPSPRVSTWLTRTNGVDQFVKIIVADSGAGVPDADAERIFDPFFTTKEPGKGTGLGLAIVARSVENLGGIVWVERAREGGAALHLFLPLAGVLQPGEEAEPWRA
jgi:two-component system, NtrC family, sensor kinase